VSRVPVKIVPLVFTLALTVSGVVFGAGEESASLVPNGNFENRSKGGEEWPDGWGSWAPGNGKTWEVESDMHFVRLVSQKPGQLQLVYRELNLRGDAPKGIDFKFRYRTAGVKTGEQPADGAGAIILFNDNEGRILNSDAKPVLFSNLDPGWKAAEVQALVPQGSAHYVIMAGLFKAAAGTVDLASIFATPLADSDIEKLAKSAPKGEAPAESLVTNGDFEKLDKAGDWPEGWGKNRPEKGTTWETENDKRYVRIVSQEPGQMLTLSRNVPLKPGAKGVELTIRYRATGVRFGEHEWFDARTFVHFLGTDGKPLANEGTSLDFVFTHKSEPTGWVERTRTYDVPEGAVQMQLMPGFFRAAAGTLDLAEVRVTPMSDAGVALMNLADNAYGIWKGEQNGEMERRVDAKIGAQLAATGNLVPNGDFSAAAPGTNWPEEWGRSAPENLSWETEGGKHFIRIVSPSPEKMPMLYKMVLLNKGLKAVEVKIRYRTANLEAGPRPPGNAQASMHFLEGGRFGHLEYGREMGPEPEPIPFSPDAKQWTEITRRMIVPEGATKLQFMPGLWGVKSGTLDLAEIQVRPLSDADAAMATPAK